jgi:cytochrome c oxidase subunit 1
MVSVVATILFIYIVYDLFVNGKEVGKNPWLVPVFFTSTTIDSTQMLRNPSETLE